MLNTHRIADKLVSLRNWKTLETYSHEYIRNGQ
ncbi:unnamed protein product [Schistosoma margrebowiei]|uniref:Uncharacterized protein n=1 Tax=Schistosoma margrebowiei TaxID=48269 RepID=A0A3P8DU74_9TREM|nr:unnamed protein product [Schistosoma margrebowiei]